MSRIVGVVVCLAVAAAPALADPPRRMFVMPTNGTKVISRAGNTPTVIDSHVVYINPCMGGCQVHPGNTDSRADTSDIVSTTGTLGAYPYGTTKWGQVKTCVQGVMAPFNIQVTDVDPGTVDHFEIMVAGNACDILQSNPQIGQACQGIGGIADFSQGGYIPDALVFDFTESWNGNVTQDCATIAQEIAHAWGLDHVIERTDPMTYNSLQTPLKFQDGAVCGSDCQINGGSCVSPFGLTCSGSCGSLGNSNATHACSGNGQATQDEVQIIKGLFGPAGAVAPTLMITSPANGAAVQAGFEVDVTCTSSDGIQQIDFSVDGVQKATLTSSPAKFTAPTTLTDGSHMISVFCATNLQATQTVTESVIVGEKCAADSDCTKAGYICYQQACIAGPDATGGLGDMCSKNADCSSNSCASDGTTSACVVPCDTSNDQCPSGFGCLPTGSGSAATSQGVCFPGAAHGDSGGGCCDAGQGAPAGPLLLSGVIAALWITRRKRAKS
jgi:hypothetical protein